MKSTTLIRPLNPLTDNLTEIAGLINQAYRGRESWTNENGLISGPRVRVDELMNMDDTVLLLVLNKEDSQSSPDAAADDSSSPPPPPRVIGTLQISLGKGEEDEEETVREGRQQQYSSGSAPDQHSHNAELGLFSIHPSFQRRGLGKMLLMHGIEYAKSRNKAGACMWGKAFLLFYLLHSEIVS